MIKTEIGTNGIGHLIVDLPGRSMNVLEPLLVAGLRAGVESLVASADVKGIVIRSGKASFIAGADLQQMAAFAAPGVTPQQVVEGVRYLGDFFRRIETCGKPVVAAASGTALGGGLELMLACHYRIAADVPKAQFGFPEVKLGLLPGAGGTQRVPRLIGIAKSIPMLTGGASMSAAEAQRIGLLNEVVPAEALVVAAEAAILDGRFTPGAPWDRKEWKLPGGDAYAPANAAALMIATSQLNAATKGHYPAPIAILRCIHDGSKLPIDRALKLEMQYFAQLVQSDVAQNLIRTTFFAKQAADKLVRRPPAVPKSSISRLGVLGAGFMGQGVARVSAQAGIDVVLVDREPAIANRARDAILQSLDSEVAAGKLSADTRDAVAKRVKAGDAHESFAGCELVVEAVLEDPSVKADAIRRTEAHLDGSAIFASNTSALPIDGLAQSSARPDHLIGLHFFSPVHKMALVEVVVGSQTSEQTLARALDYCAQIRKTPIIVGDGYGFYTTRCVDAYIREGFRMVSEGVSPALIENCGVALGMPVGPLALADEVGIDVMCHVAHFFRSHEKGEWADDKHELANQLFDAKVEAKRFGRKSGAGFYDYPEGSPKRLHTAGAVSETQPSTDAIQERLLFAQIVEAVRCWADGVVQDTSEADLGAQLAWAFPSYLGGPFAYVDDLGGKAFVARCDALARTCGPRFEVPERLRTAVHARGWNFEAGVRPALYAAN